MRRTVVPALAVLALGCGLDGELKGQACDGARDCARSQDCVRTDEEKAADLPGVCAHRGTDCAVGRQLGCQCDPADLDTSCLLPAVPIGIDYPDMVCDPTTRVCVVDPGDTGGTT